MTHSQHDRIHLLNAILFPIPGLKGSNNGPLHVNLSPRLITQTHPPSERQENDVQENDSDTQKKEYIFEALFLSHQ